MERQQEPFNKIIGGTDDQKEILRQSALEESSKSGQELFGEYLINPTEEEVSVIYDAIAHANTIAAHYGSVRNVQAERVFLLQPDAVSRMSGGKIKQGFYDPFQNSIAIERTDSLPLLASHVFHESLHATSYQAAQVYKDESDGPYRSGIEMISRNDDQKYFSYAQEAIIAILNKKFFDTTIANNQLYSEEIDRTRKIKEELIRIVDSVYTGEQRDRVLAIVQSILILPRTKFFLETLSDTSKNGEYKISYFAGYFKHELESGNVLQERTEEVEKFDNVLDRTVRASNGVLKSKDELFDDFARAHFTENYLDLARKIESVLGKGSFRKIAIELGGE